MARCLENLKEYFDPVPYRSDILLHVPCSLTFYCILQVQVISLVQFSEVNKYIVTGREWLIRTRLIRCST